MATALMHLTVLSVIVGALPLETPPSVKVLMDSPRGQILTAAAALPANYPPASAAQASGPSSAKFSFVLAAGLKTDYAISTVEALGYPADATLYALEGATGEVLKLNGTLPIKALTSSQSQLLTVALDSGYGYAFLGEQGKWLSVSSQRFSDLVYGNWGSCESVAVTGGGPGSGKEGVTVRWMTPYG